MRKPVQHRAAGAIARATPKATETLRAMAVSTEADSVDNQNVSFAKDIRPMFAPFVSAMMWRFDLTSYEAVAGNAQTIYDRISNAGNPMPPPPFPMLTPQQIQMFSTWMNNGCKP